MAATTGLIDAYKKAKKRLLLFDYDGTLLKFHDIPAEARPTRRLLRTLSNLSQDEKNTVAIVSGRDRSTLARWFEQLPIILVAEHGAFVRYPHRPWTALDTLDTSWKTALRPLMENSAMVIPGSSIEEKETALVWHYRAADTLEARAEAQMLTSKLQPIATPLGVSVKPGNKIVEARQGGIPKGQIPGLLNVDHYDFAMAAGDDVTDEDLFAAMPSHAYTIKIGPGETKANSRQASPSNFINFLQSLSE